MLSQVEAGYSETLTHPIDIKVTDDFSLESNKIGGIVIYTNANCQ